jgi:hypothetical protein
MPPTSQTETVEPQNVASHPQPMVDPNRAATSILTGSSVSAALRPQRRAGGSVVESGTAALDEVPHRALSVSAREVPGSDDRGDENSGERSFSWSWER